MKYRRFDPLERHLSVLALGTAGFFHRTERQSIMLLEAWLEAGGNVIDTAREYGDWGESEAVLGRWLACRGSEPDICILTKCGHPRSSRRRLTPAGIRQDLCDSLHALGRESVDLLLTHRDDPAVEVGPIVDTLNELLAAGRVHALGASNWAAERIEAANRYAARAGLTGFCCSSPGLSLAEPREPYWEGCVSARDRVSRSWYQSTQLPLFAWSPLARGFFAGRQDARVEHVFGGDQNRMRRDRAAELGRRCGKTPTQIALAWVLHLPFPTFPIIGPATVAELDECLGALEIELSLKDMTWLETGDAGPNHR